MHTLWEKARATGQKAGADRNRYVDALRAYSILVVVLGHWLMAAPEITPSGDLKAGHILADLPWTQWLTWVFQVMPIFFVVGGYSNAASWRSSRERGTPYGEWLHARLRRLVLPVLALLAVWTVIAAILIGVGFDRELVKIGSQTALVPVWFLAVYVAVAALAPVALILWDRFGWASVTAMGAAAVVTDLVSISTGNDPIGFLNYLFIWGGIHQLGFAWRDGRLADRKRSLSLAGAGLVALIVLVTLFDYPVSMVGVPGAESNNTLPPRLPLFALGLLQAGVLLALEHPARRKLESGRLWTGTVLVNGLIMTLYLWHLTAMVAVLAVSLAFDGLGLRTPAGTGLWWATRPLWIVFMAVAVTPFIVVFGRFERPRGEIPAPPAWRAIAAVVLVCAGLGTLAYFGVGDESGLNWEYLALPFAGALTGRIIARGS
ncbi:MAG: acyltransferase [Acidimicrobiia bacterium]|nr:acyltransferase [Acidimicrobiia bacterium]